MNSEFDIKSIKSEDRNHLLQLARLAENSERFEDMCAIMKRVISLAPNINMDERNLLSIAYKNAVGSRRTSWRAISSELEAAPEGAVRADMEKYKAVVEKELHSKCHEVLEVIEKNILPDFDKENAEGHIYFLKMAADYYRYLAETGQDEGKKTVEYYKKAYEIAEKSLVKTHPTKL
ncbi:hypothetical protein MHBO_002402, partial [Bonamia ostreae]